MEWLNLIFGTVVAFVLLVIKVAKHVYDFYKLKTVIKGPKAPPPLDLLHIDPDSLKEKYTLIDNEILLAIQENIHLAEYKPKTNQLFKINIKYEWVPIDKGRILITNKAIVFEGDRHSYRHLWANVPKTNCQLRSFKIHFINEPVQGYVIDIVDEELNMKFAFAVSNFAKQGGMTIKVTPSSNGEK